jgi:uncharacterized protein (TIGR00730 family)
MSDRKPKRSDPGHLFPTAAEDLKYAHESRQRGFTQQQLESKAYRLAFDDMDFLLSEELRGVRLMLELDKPDSILKEHDVVHTVAIYGSARLESAEAVARSAQQLERDRNANPQDPTLSTRTKQLEVKRKQARYYEEARRFASLVTSRSQCEDCPNLTIVTGGGPGIMEAGNLGAHEAGGDSIGMNIVLPHEQFPNPFVSPQFCFQFHYFAIRKMHFLLRARALVVFPGGWGTLDELFESLTLVQTKKIAPLPILIFGREFWEGMLNFDYMVEQGVISEEDLKLFSYVETAEEAWDIIKTSLQE